nr:hypothetical protein CFP56_65741 [Quercus suber]
MFKLRVTFTFLKCKTNTFELLNHTDQVWRGTYSGFLFGIDPRREDVTSPPEDRVTSANQLKLPRQLALLRLALRAMEKITTGGPHYLAICLTRGAWEIQEKLIISLKEYWWR